MKANYFTPSSTACAVCTKENCNCTLAFKNIFTPERSLIDKVYEPLNYKATDFIQNTLNMQIYGTGSNILIPI